MPRGKSRVLELIVVITLVGGAVATSFANLARRHREPSTKPLEVVRDWKSLASVGHHVGARDPKVTVVVFSDYQCVACQQWTSRMMRLVAEHPAEVAVVFRHYPLASRSGSLEAAVVAECSGREGKFLEMHSALLASAESLGVRSWGEYARGVGIQNLARFDDCLRSESAQAAVIRDREAARDAYVTATPTFFVGEDMYAGVPWDLEDIITRAVEGR